MKILPFVFSVLLGATLTIGQAQETTPIKPVDPKPLPPVAGPPQPEAPEAEPVPEKETPAEPEAPVKKEPETYVVKSGDNPWTIAKSHGVELAELMKINEIKDAKNLKVGNVLVLPGGVKSKNKKKEEPVSTEEKPPVAEVVEESPDEGDDWAWHTVQKGENPWTIAKKLKVDHQKIMGLNEGVDFRALRIGQKIKVPKE